MSETKKNSLFDIKAILDKIAIDGRQNVAELGCGNFGFFVWPLAKAVGKDGLVYAVDILKSALEEVRRQASRENFPQVKTVWSNLEIFKATKIESNSLDAALLINILNQSEKRGAMLREAVRMLKRGACLLVVEWKAGDLPFGPNPEKRVKIESLKLAIPKVGLDIKEEFEAGPFHYGLVLTKL